MLDSRVIAALTRRYDDPDQRRSASVVAVIGIALLLLCVTTTLLSLRWTEPHTSEIIGTASVFYAGALVMLWRGRLRLTSVTLVIVSLLVVTLGATYGQGIRDYVVMAYPVILLFVSLLDGRRGMLIGATIVTMASMGWLAAGEAYGWYIPHPAGRPDWTDGAVIALFLIVAVLTTDLLSQNLRHALAGARRENAERQRTEAALTESEARYRALFDHAGDFVMVSEARPGGVPIIVAANDALANAHGYTKSELIGQPVTLIDPTLEPSQVQTKIEAMRDGSPVLFERTHRRRDGSELDVEVHLTPVTIGDRTLTLGIERDITTRKQTERALRESEQRLQDAQDLAGMGHWSQDHATSDLTWSPQLFQLYGFDPGTPPSWSVFRELILPEDRDRIQGLFYTSLEDGPYQSVHEFRARRTSGELLYIRARYRTSLDPVTRRWRTIGIDQNVTALRESEERFTRAFNASPVLLVIARLKDGMLLEVNGAFEQATGYSREEAIGKTAAELNLWVNHKLRAEIVQALVKGNRVHAEVPFRAKDGTEAVHDFTAEPFEMEGERCTLAAAADLSERELAEAERERMTAQLHQAQKFESIGTLASGIAHDFNNILNIIMGNVDLLSMEGATESDPIGQLSAVRAASERGAGLVRQLLTIGRKTKIERKDLSLNAPVIEVVKLIGETFPRTIAVTVQIGQGLPSVNADPNQLHQVLLNLAVNARDAMPSGGALTFTTSCLTGDYVRQERRGAPADDYVCVSVADTGVGMTAETIKKVFDPFYTTKAPGKGTGLGLALVRSILEQHEGFVDVVSTPGAGTCFTVMLPAVHSEPAIETSTFRPLSSAPGGTETILVVEDESMARDMVASLLSGKGYRVLATADGAAGVEMFTRHRHDIALVLSDFGLPEFAGDEVFRRIHEMEPAVPFVLMTGFIEPEQTQAFTRMGMAQIVFKPFNGFELLEILRLVLDQQPRRDTAS